MGTVTKLRQVINHVHQSGAIIGVECNGANDEWVRILNNGAINGALIPKHETKQLLIAWLSINYPEVLKSHGLH